MRLQNFLLALVTAVLLTSCGNPLQKQVDQINGMCPVKFGDAGALKGASLDGNNVIMDVEVDESVVQMLQSNTPMAHEVVIEALRQQSGQLKALFDEIIRRGGTFSYRFADSKRKKEYVQPVTAEELNSILEEGPQAQTREEVLRQVLLSTQKQFPLVTNVMTMDSLTDDGDYVRYYATVDTLFGDMARNALALHDNLLREMTSSKETLPFLEAVMSCEKGIAYRYTDRRTGRAIDVLLTIDEMNAALGN